MSAAKSRLEPGERAGQPARNLRKTSGSAVDSPSTQAPPAGTQRIGVLVLARHRLYTDVLSDLLEAEDGIAVVGHAGTIAEGLTKLGRLDPDIVLVDFRLADGSVVDFANATHRQRPNAKLILLAEEDRVDARFAAVEAGAVAFVQTSRAEMDLSRAIRHAAAGRQLISPQSIAAILSAHHRIQVLSEQITPREMETLRLLAEGVPTREIARRLGVTYATVRTHIYRLSKRLGAHSKLEVVARARAQGLI